MAWLSRNDFIGSEQFLYSYLNNLSNDIRNPGGDINMSAYALAVGTLTAGGIASVGSFGIGTLAPSALWQVHSAALGSGAYLSSAAPQFAFGDHAVYTSATKRARLAFPTATDHFLPGITAAGDLILFTEHVPASGFAVGSGSIILATASGNSSAFTMRMIIDHLIQVALACVPIYANNAAAIAGGLAVGHFYRTGANPDPLCIVHT